MKGLLAILSLIAALIPAAARADSSCAFVLGFKALHDVSPAAVGDCTENQAYAPNGDALQHTTHGLMVWRKADNWTAFTDGYRTWINGPNGLQTRLNSERFPWEPAAAAQPTPALSYTWSGYIVSGGPFTAVEGTWVVPVFAPVSGIHGQSVWVGLGGWGSVNPLLRAGVAARNGLAGLFPSVYGADQYAWHEFLPNQHETTLPIPVRALDTVHVRIAAVNSRWQINIDDLTNGQHFVEGQDFPGADQTTAEWIFQAPTSTAGAPVPTPLSSKLSFSNCSADTASGQVLGPSQGQAVQMTNGSSIVNTPRPATGQDFAITGALS
jgi:hypothetical protein